MDLPEFIKAKRELEANIRMEVQAQLDDFQRRTGLSPDGVYIRMSSLARLSMPPTYEHIISEVAVSVPIE